MDVAVILICEPTYNEVLAREAVVCINSLRAYGGKYKDIPIHIIIPTAKPLSKDFLKFLTWARIKKGVHITKEHLVTTPMAELSRGFLNIPFGMEFASREIDTDIIVYCDCDVIFYRQPKFDLLDRGNVYVDKSIDTFKDESAKKSWKEVEEFSGMLLNNYIDSFMEYKQANTWLIAAKKDHFIWQVWLDTVKMNLEILLKHGSEILTRSDFKRFKGWDGDYQSMSYPVSLIEEMTFSQIIQLTPEDFKDVEILNTAFDYLDKDADIFHFDSLNNLTKGKECKQM
jgi:hypothetical protein